MYGLSNVAEKSIFDHLFGIAPYTAPASLWVALYSTHITDAGTATEVVGNSIPRVEYASNGTNWASDANNVYTNQTDITFPEATGNVGFVKSAGFVDAVTAGNILLPVPFLNPAKSFSADATTNAFTIPSHGYVDGDEIIVFEPINTANLPSAVADMTEYFVISSTADAFQVAATSGGAAIDIGSGSGYVAKTRYRDVTEGTRVILPAGSISFTP